MSRATSSSTQWECPTCRARGTIEHSPTAGPITITALVATAHCIVQPRCHGTPTPITNPITHRGADAARSTDS